MLYIIKYSIIRKDNQVRESIYFLGERIRNCAKAQKGDRT